MVDCETEMLPSWRVQRTNDDTINWSLPPEDWAAQLAAPRQTSENSNPVQPLPPVHVWAGSLLISPEAVKTFAATLAPEEVERAARFHFAIHRDRFIVGRGLLRKLLAGYLGTEPGSLEFSYGPQGKPALIGHGSSLHFNLAHSEDLILIGVTRIGRIGVDVERVRELDDYDELVARFFSQHECLAFRKLPGEQKPAAFFNLWTRKEAWLKATGEGITHLLNQVEVSFLPSKPARLLRLPETYLNTFWSLYELTPQPGFTAALALAGDAPAIHCWQFQRS